MTVKATVDNNTLFNRYAKHVYEHASVSYQNFMVCSPALSIMYMYLVYFVFIYINILLPVVVNNVTEEKYMYIRKIFYLSTPIVHCWDYYSLRRVRSRLKHDLYVMGTPRFYLTCIHPQLVYNYVMWLYATERCTTIEYTVMTLAVTFMLLLCTLITMLFRYYYVFDKKIVLSKIKDYVLYFRFLQVTGLFLTLYQLITLILHRFLYISSDYVLNIHYVWFYGFSTWLFTLLQLRTS